MEFNLSHEKNNAIQDINCGDRGGVEGMTTSLPSLVSVLMSSTVSSLTR